VDNRPGVSTIPGQVVSQSPPDGYTILVYGPGTWLSQFLRKDVPYLRVPNSRLSCEA